MESIHIEREKTWFCSFIPAERGWPRCACVDLDGNAGKTGRTRKKASGILLGEGFLRSGPVSVTQEQFRWEEKRRGGGKPSVRPGRPFDPLVLRGLITRHSRPLGCGGRKGEREARSRRQAAFIWGTLAAFVFETDPVC